MKTLRTCPEGHQYFKSSDCPTCPICEENRKPQDDLLSGLAAPARRALEKNCIFDVKELSKYREAEILEFHGMGKGSIPKLKEALAEAGLDFRTT